MPHCNAQTLSDKDNAIYRIGTRYHLAFIPESFDKVVFRQVSWLVRFPKPSHPNMLGQWPMNFRNILKGLTVAGTAPDFSAESPDSHIKVSL